MWRACSSLEIDRMLLRLPGDKFFGSLNRMGASFSIDFMQVLKRKKERKSVPVLEVRLLCKFNIQIFQF
jgi:hypothetical protein